MCEGGNVMVKISGANFDDMEEVEKELGLFLGLMKKEIYWMKSGKKVVEEK